MSLARRRDTQPELDVRRLLHRHGMRYRVAYPVPGLTRRSIDIAFTRAKVAVFLDGCFWHACPEHGTRPRANPAWWEAKLLRNVERDAETDRVLRASGWTVLRFWEHEDARLVADTVETAVMTGRPPTTTPASPPRSHGWPRPDVVQNPVQEPGHRAAPEHELTV
jgi:DNA mismatch endonuclease (patch repair protein)